MLFVWSACVPAAKHLNIQCSGSSITIMEIHLLKVMIQSRFLGVSLVSPPNQLTLTFPQYHESYLPTNYQIIAKVSLRFHIQTLVFCYKPQWGITSHSVERISKQHTEAFPLHHVFGFIGFISRELSYFTILHNSVLTNSLLMSNTMNVLPLMLSTSI